MIQQMFAIGDSGRRVALRAQVGIVAPDSDKGWAHLFTFGEWMGHPAGPFKFDAGVCESLIRNFEAQENPVTFTYEHDNAPGQPRPASGYVQKLEVREDGMWALVEWTKRAADMIRAGEYRFCSVVVDFESTCPRTGEPVGPALLEVGLTNTPFIDGQKRIELSRVASLAAAKGKTMDPKEIIAKMAEIKVALGLAESASAEQVKAAIDAFAELEAALSGEPKVEDMKPEAMDAAKCARVLASVKKLADVANPTLPPVVDETALPMADGEAAAADTMISTKLLEATGLDAASLLAAIETNLDAVVAAITNGAQSGMPSDSEAVSASVASLTKELEDARSQLVASEVERAIELGYLPAGQKDGIIKLGRTDIAAARGLIDGAKLSRKSPPTGRLLSASATPVAPGVNAVTEQEREFVRALPVRLGATRKAELLEGFRKQLAGQA